MAALPLRATPFFELDEEFFISDELVGRLYRSSEQAILEIAAGISPRDRASLAMFCYGKAHLHGIGLTIASTCELAMLVQVMGNAVGQIIFNQSHARKAAVERATPTSQPQNQAPAMAPMPDDSRMTAPSPYVSFHSPTMKASTKPIVK